MKKLSILSMFLISGIWSFGQLQTNADINIGSGKFYKINNRKITDTNQLVNRYYVGTKGNFTTIQAAITWLSTGSNMTANSELLLDGGDHSVTDSITIDLNYTLLIRGASSGVTRIKAATGLLNKPFFSLFSDTYFLGLTIDGSTLENWGDNKPEDCIRIFSGCTYMEFTDVVFNTARVGIRVLDSADIYVFNCLFEEMTGEGVGIYNSTTKQNCFYDIEVNSFINCTKGIEFDNGDSIQFAIKNNIFSSETGTDTALYINGTTTIKQTGTITAITGNDLSHTSNGLVGIDFTDAKNANVYVRGNVNIPDKNPQGYFNVEISATVTVITTTNTWTKAAWDAYDVTSVIKLGSTGVNNVYYMPKYMTNLVMNVSLSIEAQNNGKTVQAGICKNCTFNVNNELTAGTVSGVIENRLINANEAGNCTILTEYFNVTYNDTFVIVVRNITDAVDLVVRTLSGTIR